MTYTLWITHSCRHRVEHRFAGPPPTTEVYRLRGRKCDDCLRREAPLGPALLDVEPEPEMELPELVGSPRQVSWALDLRAKKLAEAGRLMRAAQELARVKPEKADTLRRLGNALARLEQTTCARWWIDRQDRTALELLDELAAAGAAA